MQLPAIERAIFTSTRTGRLEGYQLTASSSGISAADRQELARWSPAHNSLAEEGPAGESVNFHRLASGTFCVSRTVHAGAEYSGRGGLRVFTNLLLTPPEVLARFAYNPFRILEAATAAGYAEPLDPDGERIEPIYLTGGAKSVDCILLARLVRDPGPNVTAAFVEALLGNESLAVAGRVSLRKMIAGVFSLLPVELRGGVSFSTGLKSSKQRVFRVQPLDADVPRGSARRTGEPSRLLLDEPAPDSFKHPWAKLVHRLLSEGSTTPLCRELAAARPGLRERDLAPLAEQIDRTLADQRRDTASIRSTITVS